MPDLMYSSEAINVLNRFFRVDVIVYVEGDDDVVFWGEIFEKCGGMSVELMPVGDCNQVEKYIDRITSGELMALAARDRDYLHFLGKECRNPRVLYTFGHSIENSLFTLNSILDIARICCRDAKLDSAECSAWIASFVDAFRLLCSLELAKEMDGVGEIVLGDNCSRFMISDSSELPCNQRIASHAKNISGKVSARSAKIAAKIAPNDQDGTWRSLRGHFVMSGVQKFIASRMKERGRKASISFDQLFANAILHFRSSFVSGHPEFTYYDDAVRSAAQTFVKPPA